jgi:predicted SprT family Zn-dependent metalloprotease
MNLAKLEMMANDCLRHHGLAAQGWVIGWHDRKTNIGTCHSAHQAIKLSRPLALLNNEDVMLDTVLHEIAHAIAGGAAGHSRRWKLCAQSIGARPERCGGTEVVTVRGNYEAICPGCGETRTMYRRPKGTKRCTCFRGTPWDASQHLIFKAVI